MLAKEPGSGMHMLPVNLNLDLQQAFSEHRAEAYERLLIDVMRGCLTHFTSCAATKSKRYGCGWNRSWTAGRN
ncbi:MAG: Glucose-6-phosphate 1-dehydrogenase (EC [uncultured Caballeronia sp.]|nr:MAG: Glucose-6-phosphate 1-dehydrogenase (EC [uncultured Caballeronia sp.]